MLEEGWGVGNAPPGWSLGLDPDNWQAERSALAERAANLWAFR